MTDKWQIMADERPSAIIYIYDIHVNTPHLWQIADFLQNHFSPAPHEYRKLLHLDTKDTCDFSDKKCCISREYSLNLLS